MSDMVDFHFIYAQQSPQTINNHIRKQQPASKLINTYLSTAAQYLNRTKSFHIPQNTTHLNNNNNNNKTLQTPTVNNGRQQALLTNNFHLARSVPSNMNSLNSSSAVQKLPMAYQEHRFEPELHSNGNNKSQGIVNTLRRSLKKSKERFYNKRSTTMKSCNSISNYEQSMTPTLLSRHQYAEHNTGSCMTITMKNTSSTNLLENNNDYNSEKNDQMCKKYIADLSGRCMRRGKNS
jgi:hypothetical protein